MFYISKQWICGILLNECANAPDVDRRIVANKDIEYEYRDVSVLG
jgi:hypothetical protein